MDMLCSHCRSPVEVEPVPDSGEVLCTSCGSTFRVDPDATATLDAGGRGRFGRFDLIGMAGSGTFGNVYRARDPLLDRVVALKIPRAGHLPGGADLDRFVREGRSAARLRHPAIVPVYEVGEIDGVPYIASEFVEGVTLADLLTASRPSPRESAALVSAVADALHEAHRLGVIHRDVKPSNILIRADGTPAVMDFGLAKREAGEATMTVEGQVLGTPAYMSPEQARGEGHLADARSDVYSLGAVLYQLLTGELPFRGNARMLLHQVQHHDPRPPRTLDDRIPRDLETIALKAMAKEPARRYETALALAEDLERFLSGRPILARPTGRAEAAWRWARRNPGLAASAATAGGLLAAVVGLSIGLAVQSRRAAGDLRTAFGRADANRVRAEGLASDLALDRGLSLAERGEVPRGLLWMARALALAPEGPEAAPVREAARANLSAWANDLPALRLAADLTAEAYTAAPCVFSPDGSMFASAGPKVRIRRTADGAAIGPDLDLGIFQAMVLAFSPDGRTILVGGRMASDPRSRFGLWGVADGTPRGGPIVMNHVSVLAAAFRPDGRTVALVGGDVGSRTGELRLVNVADGSPAAPPQAHPGALAAVAFSPDGRQLLAGSATGGAAFFDSLTGRPTGRTLAASDSLLHVAFSPDGRTVLTGGGPARLWDAATGAPKGPPLAHGDAADPATSLVAVAFAPDGLTVATSDRPHKTTRIWSAADGSPLGRTIVHAQPAFSLAYRPDARALVTASADGTARAWTVPGGEPLGPPLEQGLQVRSAAYDAEGEAILAGDHRGSARLWAAASGAVILPIAPGAGAATATGFRPDGARFLTISGGRVVQARDARTTAPVGPALDLPGGVLQAIYRPDGRAIVTASPAGDGLTEIRTWDAGDGRALGPAIRHPSERVALAFSPDSSVLAVSSRFGDADRPQVRLWRTADGTPIGEPMPQGAYGLEPAFLEGGRVFLTARRDEPARLWSTSDGSPIGEPLALGAVVRERAIRPDGRAVCLAGGTRARLWASDGTPLWAISDLPSDVYSLAFSPDGRTLAIGCGDVRGGGGSLGFRDARDGRPLGAPIPHRTPAIDLEYSPDGSALLVTSLDGTGRLRSAADGSAFGKPLGHRGGMQASFSPDGRRILTSGWDGSVRIWSAADGTAIGPPLAYRVGFGSAAFRPDGGAVLITSEGDARLWLVPPPAEGEARRLAAWAEVVTGMELDEANVLGVLDAPSWRDRRARLDALGGPPPGVAGPLVTPRDRALREAAHAMREGHWFGARWHLDRVIAADPDDPEPLALRAHVLLQQREWEAAASDLAGALRLGADDAGIRHERAWALAELGRFGEAAGEFAAAVRFRPDLHELWGDLAEAQIAAGDRDAFRRTCLEMMTRFREADARAVRGELLFRIAAAPEGVLDPAELLAAGEIDDESDLHPRIRGAVAFRLGRFDEAIRRFDESGQAFSPRAWDWAILAMAHERSGHREEARRFLARASEEVEASDRREADAGWVHWRERASTHALLDEARRVVAPR